MKINFESLKCRWCGTIEETFRCTCGHRTCLDCLKFPREDSCNHKKVEHIESDNWRIRESSNV